MVRALAAVIVALLCVVCFGATPRRPKPRLDGRIVGGSPVSIDDFPYQLSFLYNGVHTCGAAIISDYYVITAAHCSDGARESAVSFMAGSNSSNKDGSLHFAEKIFIHEQYDYFTIDYDVSVVRVATPFPLGSAGIAAASLSETTPAVGTSVVVSGWGRMSEGGTRPSTLQAVKVQVVNHGECSEAYLLQGGVSARMLCAGVPEGGHDACQGDSGGPLAADGQLVGLVSWGFGCARPGFPGVYTDIASVHDWVMQRLAAHYD